MMPDIAGFDKRSTGRVTAGCPVAKTLDRIR
jgi:hypothetical protein